MVARTTLGRPERVVLAGHIDTVPIADNLPARLDGDLLYGCGGCDMKSGVAVQLRLAASLPEPNRDVTYVFYDGEEVEAERNGLLRLSRNSPELLDGDLAVLLEPTSAIIEGGCQGTMRAEVRATGKRAHSARSWNGTNAIHQAGPILDVLRNYVARQPEVEGLQVPRRAERGLYQRGSGGQRHPGRVRGHREPPLRPGPHRGAGPGLRAGDLRGLGRDLHRLGRRGPPGTGRPRRRHPARGGGRHPAGQVRLDRRGPLLRTRDARGQLRPRRPGSRPLPRPSTSPSPRSPK